MGLDIFAYSGLTEADRESAYDEDGDIRWDSDYVEFHVDGHSRVTESDGIKRNTAYKADKDFHFRAGSYSTYNSWRNQLAKLAGYEPKIVDRYETGNPQIRYDQTVWDNPVDGPFMEIINFSDCDGVIGAEVSKKLAADFAEFQEKADLEDAMWFQKTYTDFRKAFEMAADGGCVVFA
jgi:hypothetical protein